MSENGAKSLCLELGFFFHPSLYPNSGPNPHHCFISFFRIVLLHYTGPAEEVVRSIRTSYQWCVLFLFVFVFCLFSVFNFVPFLLLLTPCSIMCYSVNLVVDPRTKRPKGFAFVSYESQIEAEKAMKAMNGRIVDGRLIFVEPSNEK
ncbi:hypothetical protein ACSQ67_010905 [Phaseolus vulgaris]